MLRSPRTKGPSWVRFGLYRRRTGTSVPEGKADLNGGKADIRGTTQSEAVSLKGGGRGSYPGQAPTPSCMSQHSHADIILAHFYHGVRYRAGDTMVKHHFP